MAKTASPLQVELRKLRDKYTADEVAKMCGVTRQTVYYWLIGKAKPSSATMTKLSRVTGVSLANLLR